MNSHRMTETYSNAFQVFLAHTNEKEILREALALKIGVAGATSVLDIGAGDGTLSAPLSKLVRRYVALEEKTDFTRKLRKMGMAVVDATFPCTLDETFDIVLASHSLPYHADVRMGWEQFLIAAWQHVKSNGHLTS